MKQVDTVTSELLEGLKASGVDYQSLKAALDTRDNWSEMVHAVMYLKVLGLVLAILKRNK